MKALILFSKRLTHWTSKLINEFYRFWISWYGCVIYMKFNWHSILTKNKIIFCVKSFRQNFSQFKNKNLSIFFLFKNEKNQVFFTWNMFERAYLNFLRNFELHICSGLFFTKVDDFKSYDSLNFLDIFGYSLSWKSINCIKICF